MAIEIAYTQHCGNNPSQQDALWTGVRVIQEKILAPERRTAGATERIDVAVADGVASSPFPQMASRRILELLSMELEGETTFDGRLLRRMHGYLCDSMAKGKTFGTSTTIVAARYYQDQCTILSAGDSRAYHLTADGGLRQLSRDHTVLNAMIDRGEAVAGKEYASIYNMLDSCLIADDEETDFAIHRSESSLLPGESLLLCTDGVHDVLSDRRLLSCMNPQLEALEQITALRNAVLAASAPDNFSMLMIKRRHLMQLSPHATENSRTI